MKVLMVEHFSPGNTYTEELTKALGGCVDMTVACRANANQFSNIVAQKCILYKGGEGKITALFSYLRSLVLLFKEVNSNKYDIVHVQTFKNSKLEMLLYKNRNKRVKLVHTVHNLLPHEAKQEDKRQYTEFYNYCDALIVHNEECKKQLINEFGIEEYKISVIPHGCYDVIKAPDTERQDKKTHFLMFGVIREYKGLDILLSAVSKISAEQRQNMEFVIAGKQYAKQNPTDYNAMIQSLEISDCVKLINRRIEDSELPELFAWSDACLFPYREIYGSGALLMAYSYNKPVIASDVPVFVEETEGGRTGLLFNSEDPVDLAKALCTYADWTDKERLECIKEIQKLTQGKYNWGNSARTMYALYANILLRECNKIN